MEPRTVTGVVRLQEAMNQQLNKTQQIFSTACFDSSIGHENVELRPKVFDASNAVPAWDVQFVHHTRFNHPHLGAYLGLVSARF